MFLLLQFFLSGFALGITACAIHSSIFLFPVIAKESNNWREGIKAGIYFGTGKLIIWAILGGISSYLGYLIEDILLQVPFKLASGIILIFIGIWFISCPKKCKKFLKALPPFLLGVMDGITPCAPLVGFILYLAYIRGGLYFGIFAGILFALGSVIPLILVVCGITPYLWQKVSCFSKADITLKIIGFIIFSFWGIRIIFS